jgi:outer membrane receptor protein involved in Fe transport
MNGYLLCGAAAVAILSSAAHAQIASGPPSSAEPATFEDPRGVQDIVVTAQRVGENLQKVPISLRPSAILSLPAPGSAIIPSGGQAHR